MMLGHVSPRDIAIAGEVGAILASVRIAAFARKAWLQVHARFQQLASLHPDRPGRPAGRDPSLRA